MARLGCLSTEAIPPFRPSNGFAAIGTARVPFDPAFPARHNLTMGLRGSGIAFLTFFLAGCGCAGTDAHGDDGADSDADTDVDADADSDSDSDPGTDTASETGSESDTVSDTASDCDGPAEWVWDSMVVGDATTGFDLDDHETLDADDPIGCGKIDGAGGVDNQMGPLLEDLAALVEDYDANEALATAIADGTMLVLVRTIEPVALPDDDLVTAHFFFGFDADADLENNFGGCGEFEIDPASLESPDDDRQPLVRYGTGEIVSSRFSGGPAAFQLTVPVAPDVRIDIRAEETTITWRFGEVLRADLEEGVVGGYVFLEEVMRAMREAGFVDADNEALVLTVLSGQADIDAIPAGGTGVACAVDADCGDDQDCDVGQCVEPADHCDSLSVGVAFTAVPARIVGISD